MPFILIFTLQLKAQEKNIVYECKGISKFEIVGSSGVKEEMVTRSYKFINGALQDLNNIDCSWEKFNITCESSVLNFRKLAINQSSKEVSDFLSGNKGFGQYIDTFTGNCISK